MFNLVVQVDLKKAFDTVDHLRDLRYKTPCSGTSRIISIKSESKMPNKRISFVKEND